ncbi:hypothetical protein KSS87_019860 [Heliosperma pusillum]|nr:hypothetical protein KSS87_019860 [Heliosperma pusillum]
MIARPNVKHKSMGIGVYRMNGEQNKWEELDSIGDDKILFIAPDCCFFARASDFIGWKGNRIVVHNTDSFRLRNESTSYLNDLDYEIWDYDIFMKRDESQLSIDVFYFKDCLFYPAKFDQVCSAVFWPPPKWLSTKVIEDLGGHCNGDSSNSQTDDMEVKFLAESGGLGARTNIGLAKLIVSKSLYVSNSRKLIILRARH